VAAITAASKMYGKHKALNKEDKIIKRLAGTTNAISSTVLADYLKTDEHHAKGKSLT
jgi:hypothetical protein